jgi:hypothetical protein
MSGWAWRIGVVEDLVPEFRRITLRVQRDGHDFTVDVTSDGEGLVSHAGSALLAQVAGRTGLTRALSGRLAGMKQRRSAHDPGVSSGTWR